MSIGREAPCGQFGFLVAIGAGEPKAIVAGFQEVSGLSSSDPPLIGELAGNAKTDERRELTSLARSSDVTLRRGVIRALDLFQWTDQAVDGKVGALRTVTIQLMNEDRSAVASTWRLCDARVVRHTSAPLDAEDGTLAVEELVIAHGRLEVD